jgi:hypothetical protein
MVFVEILPPPKIEISDASTVICPAFPAAPLPPALDVVALIVLPKILRSSVLIAMLPAFPTADVLVLIEEEPLRLSAVDASIDTEPAFPAKDVILPLDTAVMLAPEANVICGATSRTFPPGPLISLASAATLPSADRAIDRPAVKKMDPALPPGKKLELVIRAELRITIWFASMKISPAIGETIIEVAIPALSTVSVPFALIWISPGWVVAPGVVKIPALLTTVIEPPVTETDPFVPELKRLLV